MMVHKDAAMKREQRKQEKRSGPVTTMKVDPEYRQYLGKPNVQFINGHTVVIWNSPEQMRELWQAVL